MHWKKILCKWATIIWLDFLQVWKENCQNFTAVFVCMWFFFSAQLYDAIYKNTFLLLMQLENYFQIQDRKKIKFYVTKLYLSKLFFSNYFLYLTGVHHSFHTSNKLFSLIMLLTLAVHFSTKCNPSNFHNTDDIDMAV